MEKNKIMVVRSANKILVRTTDLSRKIPSEIDVKYEINRNETPIAQYFTYEMDPDWDVCSLDDFFRIASPGESLKIFLNCLESNAYNVFMQDSIIYNSNDKTFVQWINPVVGEDPFIIFGDTFRNAGSEVGIRQFAEQSKKLVKSKSLMGLAVVLPLAASMQYINRWIKYNFRF